MINLSDPLRARCELLIQRWRQSGSAKSYCAIDLEEVLEETSGAIDPDRRDAVAAVMDAHRPLAEIMCEPGAPLAGLGLSIERIVEAAVDEIRASRAGRLGALRGLVEALSPLEGEDVTTYPSAWEINTHRGLDGEEWAGKVRTAMAQAAIELERKI